MDTIQSAAATNAVPDSTEAFEQIAAHTMVAIQAFNAAVVAQIMVREKQIADLEARLSAAQTANGTLVADLMGCRDGALVRDQAAQLERLRTTPVDVILFCPQCHRQHIDAPQPEKGWTNPPHRTHECQFCLNKWRPYEVATNGVGVPMPKHLAALIAAALEYGQRVDQRHQRRTNVRAEMEAAQKLRDAATLVFKVETAARKSA